MKCLSMFCFNRRSQLLQASLLLIQSAFQILLRPDEINIAVHYLQGEVFNYR